MFSLNKIIFSLYEKISGFNEQTLFKNPMIEFVQPL